jgi:hypothetical protein
MPDVFDTFEEEIEARHEEMIRDLETISVDNIKTEGVTLSFGGKTFKFTDLEIIEDKALEDRIRREFREKLNNQSKKIREKINTKINQLLLMHQQKSDELKLKEEKIKNKYKNLVMMPEITKTIFHKGLSVVKGNDNSELIWLYKGKYKPKFLVIYEDGSAYTGSEKVRKAIPTDLIHRLTKPIYIEVTTKNDQITNISTKQTKIERGIFPDFSHYHTNCWGSWKSWRNKKWNNPQDILNICKEAEGVLETINQGSIATRGPTGMPRFSTVLKAVEKYNKIQTTSVSGDDEDVWEAGLD